MAEHRDMGGMCIIWMKVGDYDGLFVLGIVMDSLIPNYGDRGCCSCLARLRRSLRVLARIFLRAASLRVNTSS
jgi:hypothetical protein